MIGCRIVRIRGKISEARDLCMAIPMNGKGPIYSDDMRTIGMFESYDSWKDIWFALVYESELENLNIVLRRSVVVCGGV